MTTYDTIGRTYTRTRRADPRIAARIADALGDARSVVNLGAGAYEPADRFVVGVDPSRTMLAQRALNAGPAVRTVAESLPFADRAFDAALATLTLHHWASLEHGAAEMRRVAPRQVVFFFEPAMFDQFWLRDYFDDFSQLPTEQRAPGAEQLATLFDVVQFDVVPVPSDCVDGFGACFWNRPERYLDPDVQGGMSCMAQLDPETLRTRIARLRADLESGGWDARYGHLRGLDEYDAGYRLLIAGS